MLFNKRNPRKRTIVELQIRKISYIYAAFTKVSMIMKSEISDGIFKFDQFFELSPDLICIAGYDGYFKKINTSVSRLLGYTNEELLAKPIHEFVYLEDRDLTILSQQSAKIKGSLFNFENRYLTKDGKIVWLSWTSKPAVKEQLIYAIAKNITYKKILEEDRNQELAKLKKITNDLKLQSYTTSHDLRSPIRNLLSLIRLIDKSTIKDPDNLKYLKFIKQCAENIDQVVNVSVDLLIQKEQLNVEIEDLILNDILNNVLVPINSIILDSKATLKVDFSTLETIKFNKAYLESIFLNLITNSIKYARPDIFPEIKITSKRINGQNQLIVSDNGMGFDLEKVKGKIFGLNQTFHNVSDCKGIGLYLVYNHINDLGGRITLDSKVNEGAKFTIFFKE
jgi:PAS domain S-box-containing protein